MKDFKKDIKIDENNLETEWMTQASDFLYYAEEHAIALYERDKAKSRMEFEYSKLYSEIKKNWGKLGFDSKPTEPACKEFIVAHKNYRKAEKDYINACKHANIMLAVKNAFEHRKHALSNLVSLKIGGFYSEPRNKKRDIDRMKMAQKEGLKRKRRIRKNTI